MLKFTMILRRTSAYVLAGFRCMCANQSAKVSLEVDSKKEIATVKLSNPPVNCLSLNVLKDLTKVIKDVENSHLKGIVITSDSPKIFSAGLDLMEFYQPDKQKLVSYWTSLQDLYGTLYGTGLSTVAAINGHAIAGGCFLALMCDHRVMLSSNSTIGANESQIGITAPFWMADLMIDTIGLRQAEKALLLSKMFTSDEALKIGLIDEIASSRNELIEKCSAYMNIALKLPQTGLSATKIITRGPRLNNFLKRKDEDCQIAVDMFFREYVQATLQQHVSRLKKK